METTEEFTVQREVILEQALQVLEEAGLAGATLTLVAEKADQPLAEMQRFWPDTEALHYDALRFLSDKVDIWRRQLIHDESRTPDQKLLARYDAIGQCVSQKRYPGCLFIAACSFYPDADHPIHQIADQQKRAAFENTHGLLAELEVEDPAMVAAQMELVLEGCLSRLLVKRNQQDVDTARRLAEDILRFAQCRIAGALT